MILAFVIDFCSRAEVYRPKLALNMISDYHQLQNISVISIIGIGGVRFQSMEGLNKLLLPGRPRRGIASAEGAKLRLPKARSPLRLGGLGERRKLPSGVWGGAPETD